MIAVLMENQNGRSVLAGAMKKAEIQADRWLTVVPEPPLQESGRPRPPTSLEVNACSEERERQLEGAQYVLLAGMIPLRTYRSDLRTARAHGRPFVMGGHVMFPIFNPEACARVPYWTRKMETDLSLLRRIVDAGDWTVDASASCMWCDALAQEWDSNGVAYCAVHWRWR